MTMSASVNYIFIEAILSFQFKLALKRDFGVPPNLPCASGVTQTRSCRAFLNTKH